MDQAISPTTCFRRDEAAPVVINLYPEELSTPGQCNLYLRGRTVLLDIGQRLLNHAKQRSLCTERHCLFPMHAHGGRDVGPSGPGGALRLNRLRQVLFLEGTWAQFMHECIQVGVHLANHSFGLVQMRLCTLAIIGKQRARRANLHGGDKDLLFHRVMELARQPQALLACRHGSDLQAGGAQFLVDRATG